MPQQWWGGWWPQQPPLTPWGTGWAEMPWVAHGWPTKKEEALVGMQWMNTVLPWLQAQMQGEQWSQQFDWRKQMDEWSKQFQQQQLEAQKAAENIRAFGRRWRPNTRWM